MLPRFFVFVRLYCSFYLLGLIFPYLYLNPELPRNNYVLYLRCPFRDGRELGVPVISLNRELHSVAVSADGCGREGTPGGRGRMVPAASGRRGLV